MMKRIRRCSGEGSPPDIPYDIIRRNIFPLLPATKVYAATILSKSFRNAWCFCPDIDMNKSFSSRASREQLILIINDIVFGHSGGGARRFQLYFNPTGNEELVKSWVDRVVSLGFQDISLNFSPARHALVLNEAGLFSSKLINLKLQRCDPHFSVAGRNSLPNLQKLTIEDLTISQHLMDGIFAACNSLQSLTLIECHNDDNLQFSARTLESLQEIVFKQYKRREWKGLHSVFVNGPPSLSNISVHKENFNVKLRLAPPLVDDIAILDAYDYLSDYEDLQFWEEDCKWISRHLLLPNFAIKGMIPNENVPVASAEECHLRCPLWEVNDFHFHYPLWNVEEFHLDAKHDIVPIPEFMMFLVRCPMIQKLSVCIEAAVKGNSRFSCDESLAFLIEEPPMLKRLTQVKLWGITGSEVHLGLVIALANMTRAPVRDFILIKAKGNNRSYPQRLGIRVYDHDSYPWDEPK